ncbi:MAG TPA: DNA-binding protein WhiA [Bacillota bacterium]|nr:DNA-binding protein WhiA [Bacillota bacterium]HQD80944.1 DNA-binding protein WhiA [Bacillota bacterium]
MDFYSRMKDELIRVMPTQRCCQVAELSALVKTDGVIQISQGRISVLIRESNAGVARKVVMLLRDVGRPDTQIAVRQGSGLPRGNTYIVLISDHDQAMELLELLGIYGEFGLASGIDPAIVANRCCMRAYLRGTFLGAGYMGEPEKGYHVEMALKYRTHADDIVELLRQFHIRAGIVQRRERSVVYIKHGDDVVEFLRVIEAANALLELENTRIVRSIRNDVNRLVNAENANVSKVVEASVRQIQDIQLIDEMMGIGRLPPALREIAWLRLEYPEASLTELGTMLSPKLSKSGVNHRMRRISEIANRLRGQQGS